MASIEMLSGMRTQSKVRNSVKPGALCEVRNIVRDQEYCVTLESPCEKNIILSSGHEHCVRPETWY